MQALVDGAVGEGGPAVGLRVVGEFSQLEPEAELAVYRVAQEGLTNALRHADAAEILLELSASADGIRLTVRDNGRGFHPTDAEGPGLRGMRERALLVGADLTIESQPRGGVTIHLDVPAEVR